jgi:DNA-binding transcriptional ArsR family regulator
MTRILIAAIESLAHHKPFFTAKVSEALELEASLGIAPNILSARLKVLEANGLIESRLYEQSIHRGLTTFSRARARDWMLF